MHFFKILFIIGVLTLSANQVCGLDYNDELPVSSRFEKVSANNISAAKLLQNYVVSYEKKINALLESYNSQNTEIIQVVNKQLSQMSQSLDQIQNTNVDPSVVNNVMQSIVLDLKTINNRMKIYLEQEKQLHLDRLQSIQNNYIQIGQKITAILDSIVDTISDNLIQKGSLTEQEKEIVGSLIVIRQQSDKIKKFKQLSFESKDEMKKYFQEIIINIKKEILHMKNISN